MRQLLFAGSAAVICLLSLLAGCAKDPAPAPTPGGDTPAPAPGGNTDPKPAEPYIYYYVRSGEETVLNPHDSNNTHNLNVNDRVVGVLWNQVPGDDGLSGKYVPTFAAEEPTVDASGLVWTFKLREDVTFHDGTKMTATQVVNSFKRSMELGQGGAYIWDAALEANGGSIEEAPYLWGGKNLMGMDCSGFTQVVYATQGINLLRNAREQMTQGELIPSLAEAQPGDLAFFDHADRDPKATNISHVGMLLSPTEIIHCSGCVHIDTIDEQGIHLPDGELTHHLVQIKRYL